MTRVGFEPTPADADEKPLIRGKLSLESHTLDHSVILPYTTVNLLLALWLYSWNEVISSCY